MIYRFTNSWYIQFSSVSQSCPTLCNPKNRSMPGLLESTQAHVYRVGDASNYLILWHPLLLLPSIFPSIRVFSNESALCIRWSKYWSFSFNISPSNEQSGLISFRMDWLDLLAVQGTLKSLLQHHSSKASILPLYLPYKIRFPVERVEISLMLRSSLSLWLSKMITKLSYSIF